MKYTLENGKTVNIPDSEITNNMRLLELTREEAIQLWLEDNDYEENEEQAELDAKAKKVKIDHGAQADKPRKRAKTANCKNFRRKGIFQRTFTVFKRVFSGK